MLKSPSLLVKLATLAMLAVLAAVASCATHGYHCKTPLRAINPPAAREAK